MPSYFCSKCHRLVSAERNEPPDTFLCNECRKEAGIEKSSAVVEKIGAEKEDEEHLAVCSHAEWR